jgi:hypothetical protein
MKFRVFSGILFLLFALFLPWWFSFFAGCIFLLIYPNFWELILGALITDLTFGTPLSRFGGFTLALTVLSLILFILRRFIVRRLFIKAPLL